VAEGDAVLAEFRNYPGIELVILDYYLPRKTATEVVEQLRQARVMPACPVVVLTSHVPPSLRDALLAAGVKTVIYKPVDWDGFVELADQLHSMLRGVKPSARSESQAE
jgi:DNA-binding NarL/FixJ family response regulator